MVSSNTRGYFAVGSEGLSKPMNFGNLIRSAHAFGASFFFTVDAGGQFDRSPRSDTSKSHDHIPYYRWATIGEMQLPAGCKIVGIELVDEAIDLPSFGHPLKAAYVLGPERGSLSDEMLEKCDYVIKIPTSFCINVATAGAIVMYDRIRNFGKFDPRPVGAGAPKETRARHFHGKPVFRGGKIE
ncbi:MAG: RNA methyltransferase [Stappiaceae bacterium]